MKEIFTTSVYLGVLITIGSYVIASALHKKFPHPLTNVLLIATILSIILVIVLPITPEEYEEAAKPVGMLLTPASICLSVPLYENIGLLKKHKAALLIGITSGVLTALGSIFLLCLLFRMPHTIYVSLLPKSITTAVALGLTGELGGLAPLTIGAITITGILGNMIAVSTLKLCKIEEPIAKGVAIGTSCHIAGTSRAMEIGDLVGAVSSLSTILAALITVLGANIFAGFM